jgi:hypothetical protein
VFAIVGETREQGGELAGRLADCNQLPEHRIELTRIAAHGVRQIAARDDCTGQSGRDACDVASAARLGEQVERGRERQARA